MKLSLKNSLVLLVCCAGLVLVGCKKSSGSSYSVSVTVTGLVGTGLVMQLNSTDTSVTIANGINKLSIAGNGVSTFANQVSNGVAYSVTILNQPGLPPQTCTVTNNVGTISGSVNIPVTCPAIELSYLTSSAGNSVAPYVIDTASGTLTGSGPAAATGNMPVAFALSPSHRYAYAVNYGDNTVSAFLANPVIGLLTSAGTIGTGTSASAPGNYAIAIDPSSQFVYVINGATDSVTGFAVNSASAALSCLGAAAQPCPVTAATGNAPSALVAASAGGAEYLFVTNSGDHDVSEYAVGANGALSLIGTAAAGTQPGAIAASSVNAVILVANAADGSVASYTNVAGTLVSNGAAVLTGGSGPASVAIAPKGNFAYVVNKASNSVTAMGISASGTLSVLGTVATATGSAPLAVSVDPSGAYVYVTIPGANSIMQYSVNTDGTLISPVVQALGNAPVSLVMGAVN